MDKQLRDDLIGQLILLPVAESRDGRTTLLAGVPGSEHVTRNEGNKYTDICLIVDQTRKLGGGHLRTVVDNALMTTKGTQFGEELERIREKIRFEGLAMPELVEAENFDLERHVRRFFNRLPQEPGLAGYAFSGQSHRLLLNLCSRIRQRLKNRAGAVFYAGNYKIDPFYANVDDVCRTVRGFEPSLGKMNIILSVQAKSKADVKALWQTLSKQYKGVPDHYLAIVIQYESGKENARGFEPADIDAWVVNIVSRLGWPKALINDWITLIFFEAGRHLDIDAVYSHIAVIESQFQDRPSYAIFHETIKNRLNAYGNKGTR